MLDPEAIVLGGMIATSGDLMLEPDPHRNARRRLGRPRPNGSASSLSPLGDDAVAIGAALHRAPAA